MSAVVHTGSSDARSACGTKVSVDCASLRTIEGSDSAAAPARAVLRTSRRFICRLRLQRTAASILPPIGPPRRTFSRGRALFVTSLTGRATEWPEIAEPIPAYDPLAMNDAPHPALLPAGLYDLLPPDAEIEAEATARLMGVLASHGYQRVEPPLVEFEETLLSGAGTATASDTFRLMDPISHRMVGVRADMTPQIARIAASRMSHMPRPLRLSYAGQVLRVKGSEMRPERQIGQAGAELIGAEGPGADVEAVAVAGEALQAVGVPRLSVDLTLPTLVPAIVDAYGLAGPHETALRAALDHKDAAAVASLAGNAGALLAELIAAAGVAPATRA